MSTEQPNLDLLFEAAVAIEAAAERAAFLNEKCGDNHQLREQLERLLASDQQAGSFLERPAPEFHVTLLAGPEGENLAAALEAGLAPAFGEDRAVMLGSAGHSVLKSLGNTIDVPRVALRELYDEGPDPITRPQSPEMPRSAADSRYQLLGEIARGGMGAILRGRDTDLGRDLAIKLLLDEHKARPEVVQRFIEEAQIGGQLQHPGIAPVYELGQFADQRPFFSMKLVKGETLSKLLAEREDSSADRGKFIGIFEQVCQTMGYAHSRGVIHRDLKPANIMVGAFGEVQVMDWGLAKVLPVGGVADERTARVRQKDVSVIHTMRSVGSDSPARFGSSGSETKMGSVMGTPAYMPPEQALGEIDHMDERADVFGLGAILCEILTGKPPYVGDDGTQVYRLASRGKLDDCLARLDGCRADEDLVALTKHCLELEPKDRPRNAGELAERVTGYLESVETKLRETELQRAAQAARADAEAARAVAEGERATAESRRAAEESKRRRVSLALAASVLMLVGLGSGGWLYVLRQEADRQTAEADAQRKHANEMQDLAQQRDAQRRAAQASEAAAVTAREQAQKSEVAAVAARDDAETISEFLTEMFESTRPGDVRGGRDVKVADVLDVAAKKLETDLTAEPERRTRLQATLGSTYYALGLYREAILLQEKVRDYRLVAQGPEHSDTLGVMNDLALSYINAGRRDEALALQEEVLTLSRKVFGPEHPDTLAAMTNLASSYDDAGRRDEALHRREEVLALSRKVLGPEHPDTLAAMNNLALSYVYAGRRVEVLDLQEEVLTLRRKVSGPEHPETLGAMINLASFYDDAGRRDEALRLREEALAIYRRMLGTEHPSTLNEMHNVANLYYDVGRRDEALRLREEALAMYRRMLGTEHPSTLGAITNLANSYDDAGRRDEALNLREEVLPLRRKVSGPEHPDTLAAMHTLANSYDDAGRRDEALRLREEVLPLRRRVIGPEDPGTLAAMTNLAVSYNSAGRLAEAIALQEESLAIKRRVLPPNHPFLSVALRNLADLNMKTDRHDVALKLQEELRELATRELDQRLTAVLGGEPAKDTAELISLALHAYKTRRVVLATRFFSEAFERAPSLVDDRRYGHPYNAACCAALAASGQGLDDPQPDEDARTKLRQQALTWLDGELDRWTTLLDTADTPESRQSVVETLTHWQIDPDLVGIRDEESLAQLADPERAAWKALWTRVTELLARASAPPATTTSLDQTPGHAGVEQVVRAIRTRCDQDRPAIQIQIGGLNIAIPAENLSPVIPVVSACRSLLVKEPV